jgi:hypothetical protein
VSGVQHSQPQVNQPEMASTDLPPHHTSEVCGPVTAGGAFHLVFSVLGLGWANGQTLAFCPVPLGDVAHAHAGRHLIRAT